jgi:hypothetical protein
MYIQSIAIVKKMVNKYFQANAQAHGRRAQFPAIPCSALLCQISINYLTDLGLSNLRAKRLLLLRASPSSLRRKHLSPVKSGLK